MKLQTVNPDSVLAIIRRYTADNRVTKAQIATLLGLPYRKSNNDPVDRAIRDAVTELKKRGEPICSTSGSAGYWYDPAGVDIVIADYKSRIADMSETVRALERARRQHETRNVRQLELIG